MADVFLNGGVRTRLVAGSIGREIVTNKPKYVVIAGPTASGKSSLAMRLAAHLNGEIVACDSVQVYRGFDIGSAKPSRDEQNQIRHHMIDIAEWTIDYNADRYGQDARQRILDIMTRSRTPFVVGGTGLYLRALRQQEWHSDIPKDEGLRKILEQKETSELYKDLHQGDPARARQIHPNDKIRLVRALEIIHSAGAIPREDSRCDIDSFAEPFIIKLDPPRAALHGSIEKRTQSMIEMGLVNEVQRLLDDGCPPIAKPMQSIGYKQVVELIEGKIERNELARKIIEATRQYAKRQTTWFKKVEGHVVVGDGSTDTMKHVEEKIAEFLSTP